MSNSEILKPGPKLFEIKAYSYVATKYVIGALGGLEFGPENARSLNVTRMDSLSSYQSRRCMKPAEETTRLEVMTRIQRAIHQADTRTIRRVGPIIPLRPPLRERATQIPARVEDLMEIPVHLTQRTWTIRKTALMLTKILRFTPISIATMYVYLFLILLKITSFTYQIGAYITGGHIGVHIGGDAFILAGSTAH